MNPATRFPEANVTFKGTVPGSQNLRVYVDQVGTCWSVWEPTPDEVKELQNGGRVLLGVMSAGQQPHVLVGVCDPEPPFTHRRPVRNLDGSPVTFLGFPTFQTDEFPLEPREALYAALPPAQAAQATGDYGGIAVKQDHDGATVVRLELDGVGMVGGILWPVVDAG